MHKHLKCMRDFIKLNLNKHMKAKQMQNEKKTEYQVSPYLLYSFYWNLTVLTEFCIPSFCCLIDLFFFSEIGWLISKSCRVRACFLGPKVQIPLWQNSKNCKYADSVSQVCFIFILLIAGMRFKTI